MKVQISDLQERFGPLVSDRLGDVHVSVDHISPPDLATPTSLVFVTEAKFLAVALASPAPALVVGLKSKAQLEGTPMRAGRAILFSKNPKLAMALIKAAYFNPELPLQTKGQIHPSSVIDPSAQISQNVTVGPFCVIGPQVQIAEGARLDASVTVEAQARIGRDSHLMSNLYIGPRTEIGERCLLMPNSTIGAEGFGFAPDEKGHFHRIPQTGKVVLENEVEVGANCTIDRATFGTTRIGEGTKIDKLSHIAHNCEIGQHCILAGKFAVAGSTKIGNHFISGGRVTVKDGITITDRVEVAGLAGVNSSITQPGQYGGFPVQPVRDAMRSGASLAHLPRLRKDVARIFKHLGWTNDDATDA